MSDKGMLTAKDFRAKQTPGVERRREPRVGCRRMIKLMPCAVSAGGEEWSFRKVELLDCACHGIAVMTDEAMGLKEQFLVPLRIGTVKLLMYTVRSCVPAPAPAGAGHRSRYRIGAEYSGMNATQSGEDPAVILKHLLAGADE